MKHSLSWYFGFAWGLFTGVLEWLFTGQIHDKGRRIY